MVPNGLYELQLIWFGCRSVGNGPSFNHTVTEKLMCCRVYERIIAEQLLQWFSKYWLKCFNKFTLTMVAFHEHPCDLVKGFP